MIFEQGDIIEFNFSPTQGHEPKNTRPALVVSSLAFNSSTSMTLVCPISSSDNGFFLHEKIPQHYMTGGFVIMEQVRAFDLEQRKAILIEKMTEEDLKPLLICLSSFFSPDGRLIEF